MSVEKGAHLLVFGGQPLEGERYIDWNFVSSEQAKIEAARQSWQEKTFPMMPDEDSYVPLPARPFRKGN